jgi:hypothetical protein
MIVIDGHIGREVIHDTGELEQRMKGTLLVRRGDDLDSHPCAFRQGRRLIEDVLALQNATFV